MNKRIALVLSLVMLFSAFMPVYTMAADDAGLEDAIKKVKEFFTIPDSMKDFDYSASTRGNLTVWNLNWNSREDMGGSISATVSSDGDILSFNQYYYVDYGSIRKLPKISRQDAKAVAEGIINKLNPGILKELKISEETVQSINDETYNFNYTRLYNGIPFPSNYINVSINRQTGEIQSYNKSWTKDGNFPAHDKAISIDKAQEAYIKNLGLRLTYNVALKNDEMRIYPAFTPIYNSNYYLDAFTGERINLGYLYGRGAGSYGVEIGEAKSLRDEVQIVLSPEEIKAIDEVSNLLDQDEAEKIARGLSILGLDDGYKVRSAGLNRNWPSKKDFVWNFYFQKESKDGEEDFYPVSVSLNAKTGEIIGFNAAKAIKLDEKAKFDKEASKEAVDKFLTDFAPLRYNEVQYEEVDDDIVKPYKEGEEPKTYSFRYIRKVDGIPFPDNGISVLFDAVSGKVISYNLSWYNDVEFPSTKEAISIDKVYDNFFNSIGLELQYFMSRSDIIYAKAAGVESDAKEEIKLVYAVKEDKPVRFDLNGAILDSDGEPYKERKAVEYNDISGHYAEKVIKVLAESGIALEGPEFRPGEEIKQKDFLLLISQIVNNGYQFFGKTALNDDKETEDLYNLLIREGIIKQEEKNPEASLTREESVKFFIRLLKYDKVADLKNIFNCTFKDKDEISPELIGYVVIANGLNIVKGDGDYFRPKNKLSRADAVLLIYNYLQM